MSQGSQAVRQFMQGMLVPENLIEFVIYNSMFFLLSIYIGNLVDNFFNKVFLHVERTGWANKDSNIWLVLQIIIQLIFVSATSYMVRLFVVGTMLSFSSDKNIYDAKAVSIIYAMITFAGQNHLKEKLERFNKLMDA